MFRRVALVVVAAVLALGPGAGAAHADPPASPDRHGTLYYTFKEIRDQDRHWLTQQVAPGDLAGFEQQYFDDSSWPQRDAGFGTTDSGCPGIANHQVHTRWDAGKDLLLRHSFGIPPYPPLYVTSVRLSGTIVGSADIYVNGVLQTHVDSSGCQAQNVDLELDDYGEDGNTLAIRASDPTGGPAYVDLRLTVRAQQDCDCLARS